MRKIRHVVVPALIVCFGLSCGCSGLQKPALNRQYFELAIRLPRTQVSPFIDRGNPVLIRDFGISPGFDTHSFVFRITEKEYTRDFYTEFTTHPARQITDQIADALYASPHFIPYSAHSRTKPGYRLSGKINRLYCDLQQAGHPVAIVEIRLILEKENQATGRQVLAQTYTAAQPLPSSAPEHIITGWNSGLEQITADFIRDVELQGSFH